MISVDLFAGGGGASEGIRRATDRAPIVAVNHCPASVAMHAANHPGTDHRCESVYRVHPRQVVGRRKVDLLWASPDCRHFSRAKGGRLRSERVRGLAWVVLEWVEAVRPRVVCVENVQEFTTWGPLNGEGRPIRERAGETFRQWVAALQLYGYRVEWRVLCAADYGAPTSRRRLFIVARCDGAPIRWPEPTHGPGCAQPWRSAAECVDWSVPSCSIFASPAEAKEWRRHHGRRGTPRRPMAEATLRRVAEELRRYVLEQPLGTVVAGGSKHAVLSAYLDKAYGSARAGQRICDPMPTITTGGGRGGQHTFLVSAWVSRHYGGGPNGNPAPGLPLSGPLGTVTARDSQGLTQAHLEESGPELPAGDGGQRYRRGEVAQLVLDHHAGTPLAERVQRDGCVRLEVGGVHLVVTDLSLRLFEPRELARAQGFPDSYILTGTKAERIARIGNAVPPQVVEAVVRAQLGC